MGQGSPQVLPDRIPAVHGFVVRREVHGVGSIRRNYLVQSPAFQCCAHWSPIWRITAALTGRALLRRVGRDGRTERGASFFPLVFIRVASRASASEIDSTPSTAAAPAGAPRGFRAAFPSWSMSGPRYRTSWLFSVVIDHPEGKAGASSDPAHSMSQVHPVVAATAFHRA